MLKNGNIKKDKTRRKKEIKKIIVLFECTFCFSSDTLSLEYIADKYVGFDHASILRGGTTALHSDQKRPFGASSPDIDGSVCKF